MAAGDPGVSPGDAPTLALHADLRVRALAAGAGGAVERARRLTAAAPAGARVRVLLPALIAAAPSPRM